MHFYASYSVYRVFFFFLLEIIPLFPEKTPKVQVRSWSDHYGAEMDGVCKYGVYALKEQGAKALIIHVHCLH